MQTKRLVYWGPALGLLLVIIIRKEACEMRQKLAISQLLTGILARLFWLFPSPFSASFARMRKEPRTNRWLLRAGDWRVGTRAGDWGLGTLNSRSHGPRGTHLPQRHFSHDGNITRAASDHSNKLPIANVSSSFEHCRPLP